MASTDWWLDKCTALWGQSNKMGLHEYMQWPWWPLPCDAFMWQWPRSRDHQMQHHLTSLINQPSCAWGSPNLVITNTLAPVSCRRDVVMDGKGLFMVLMPYRKWALTPSTISDIHPYHLTASNRSCSTWCFTCAILMYCANLIQNTTECVA